MYCPNCGQQQVSHEMRYCSRCGMALSGLAEWMAGGNLPAKAAEKVQVSELSPRRKGIRRAAKLMFFSTVLFPVFLVISLAIDEGAPLIFPLIPFFVSVVWMLYARLFSDPTSARASLPPVAAKSMPGPGRQQVRTNELAQPPSVTDHTTRLLDNE